MSRLCVALLGLVAGAAAAVYSPCSAARPPAAGNFQLRAACISAAAQRYNVPEPLIHAVIRTEGGTTGQTSRKNKNGTVDLGLMQINEIHLRRAPHNFEARGITRELLINDECLNIHIGTYILSWELAKPGSYWFNVGAYNSRTPDKNLIYQRKVAENLLRVLQGR